MDSAGVGSRVNSRISSLKQDIADITALPGTGFAKSEPQTFDNLPGAQQYIATLEGDLSRRQESYIRRERGYRTRIEDLESEVSRLKAERCSWGDDEDKMNRLKELHGKVLTNIDNVKERTRSILQEQERDLLRAFRARLFDVQSELEREKNRSNDGASVWIEKNRQLERDLEWARQMADRLERVNQSLTKENTRLKSHFKTHEEDREFLIRQLVAVKKDNVRLKEDIEKLKEQVKEHAELPKMGLTDVVVKAHVELNAPHSNMLSRDNNSNSQGGVRSVAESAQSDARYREIVRRLKRLLETERGNLRKVRKQYMEEIAQRTEVQHFLRLALQDVKREITVKRTSKFLFGPGASSVAVNSAGRKATREQLSPHNNDRDNSEGKYSQDEESQDKTIVTGDNVEAIEAKEGGKESGTVGKKASGQRKVRGTSAKGGKKSPSSSGNRPVAQVEALPKTEDVFLDDFTPDLRERTLEILLSQERVVKLLYAKAFPSKTALDAKPPSAHVRV
jgi:hypothetical protein